MTVPVKQLGTESEIMEKEIGIDRQKILTYTTWKGFMLCVLLVPAFGMGLLLAIIHIMLIVWFYPKWAAVLRYCFDDKALRVERGILFRSRKTIPLDKITDLELFQGPLLRALDMWVIKVQTASTGMQTPEAVLYGVVHPEQIRDEILAARNEHMKSR